MRLIVGFCVASQASVGEPIRRRLFLTQNSLTELGARLANGMNRESLIQVPYWMGSVDSQWSNPTQAEFVRSSPRTYDKLSVHWVFSLFFDHALHRTPNASPASAAAVLPYENPFESHNLPLTLLAIPRSVP